MIRTIRIIRIIIRMRGDLVFTESKTIELKREYTEDIRKSVTAFANTDGGKIYIGIQYNGIIVGISQKMI